MQVSPDSPPPKRSRAKAKPKDAADATAKPRKAKTKITAEPVASGQLPPADMTAMIATAAYYLAAGRNFSPGHELDDWLEAERRLQTK